jgi:uncharacterized protein YjeT (DUF2065 family)
MRSIGNLAEALLLVAIGAFMVFAPNRAERLNRSIPFLRTGRGALRKAFGWGAVLLGCVGAVVWLVRDLAG